MLRAVERAILHLDMDAFYASVEQRDDPSLRGRPVIVGGHPRRGVVLAASYEVRPFGVRSALSMVEALQRAPQAIVVPPRFSAYAAASAQVFALFAAITPLCEPLSLDEAFLDVTGSQRLFGPPAQIARELRRRIAAEVGLPCSAGIAAVKFAAKVASDLAKPNGQREVPAAQTRAFLAPLPVSRLWGVGPRTEEALRRLGLRTIGDIAAQDVTWLSAQLGDLGPHLHALSLGQDERPVVPDREAKSIGAEDTFAEDLADEDTLRAHVHGQALRVAARLRSAGVRCRCVQLKLKASDHKILTRRTTLAVPSDDGQVLYQAATTMLQAALRGSLRLTGVSAQELVPAVDTPAAAAAPIQLSLFAPPAPRAVAEREGVDPAPRRRQLNQALDQIHRRFGQSAVLPADVLELSGPPEEPDEAARRAGASRLDRRRS